MVHILSALYIPWSFCIASSDIPILQTLWRGGGELIRFYQVVGFVFYPFHILQNILFWKRFLRLIVVHRLRLFLINVTNFLLTFIIFLNSDDFKPLLRKGFFSHFGLFLFIPNSSTNTKQCAKIARVFGGQIITEIWWITGKTSVNR